MRRKLTALMALLMLAGAGMIAPTATAQEYEGSYVTQLSSDGTITEFIAVRGVTEESCKSTKYKPTYDPEGKACLIGVTFKGERINKAFTLKLTSNGGTSYSFEFSTLSVSDYEALAHDVYRGDSIKITRLTLALPVGSVITNGHHHPRCFCGRLLSGWHSLTHAYSQRNNRIFNPHPCHFSYAHSEH